MTSSAKKVRIPRHAASWAAALVAVGLAHTVAVHAVFTSRCPGVNAFYARLRPTRAWLLEGRRSTTEIGTPAWQAVSPAEEVGE